MSEVNIAIQALNSGQVSPSALARTDLAKLKVAFEVQQNLFPKVLGPAMFRPGTEMIGTTRGNMVARLIPFLFNTDQKAQLELTAYKLRPLINGLPIICPAVTATVPAFASWTNIDQPGASSGIVGGNMSLTGTTINFGGQRTSVTVAQTGVEHALHISVLRGPVSIRIGTSAGATDYLAETSLRTGEHSIAFTPTGNFWIDIKGYPESPVYIAPLTLEPSGPLEIPTLWGQDQLPLVRYVQSGDVVFCACAGVRQQRIERRSQRSWSVVDYVVDDGPFRPQNLTSTTLALTQTKSHGELNSSQPIFSTQTVGALFRLTTPGQQSTQISAGAAQYTDAIRVTGVGGDRAFGVAISGTWTPGTIRVQKSVAEPGNWVDLPAGYTANGVYTVSDGLDNQIIYYRAGFGLGSDYVSGAAAVTVFFGGGSQTAVVRATDYISPSSLGVDILKQSSLTLQPTRDWSEGQWSSARGFPSSDAFHDGRLWWARSDTVFGSVSDGYESFDDTIEGDSGPVVRSITAGGFEGMLWMLSLQRLITGTASQEVSIRSSSFDEPITPTAFTARDCSTRGSKNLQAIKIDSRGVFVQRDGKHIFELAYDVQGQDYGSKDLTRLSPEICGATVVDIASQRQPDTRIWFVLADGTCAVLTYERDDEVVAWTPFVTDGFVENVCVLPAAGDDEVYLVVKRTVNGTDYRFIERVAKEADTRCGNINRTSDCHILRTGSPTTTISVPHLTGRSVVAWGDGKPLITTPVVATGGTITLPVAASNVVVGLPYTAKIKTTKLAYGAQKGTALIQRKRVNHLGVLMRNVCPEGVRIGRDFVTMTGLARLWRGRPLAAGEVVETYDQDASSFQGSWDTDSRVCLSMSSPYGGEFLALVASMETNERGTGYQAPQRQGQGQEAQE